MGMSSPTIPGQVADLARQPSVGIAKPSRQESAASVFHRDSGLNQRVPGTHTGRPPTVIKRKKLPWLDDDRQNKTGRVPGAFEDVESMELVSLPSASPPPQPPPPVPLITSDAGTAKATDEVEQPFSKRPSINSLGHDLSVRAIGSTQSVSQREKQVQRQRTLSLSSEPRPGVRPVASKQHAKQAFGLEKGKKGNMEDYTPSEYSTTISSSDVEYMPAMTIAPTKAMSKQKPNSELYKRQVQKAVNRKEHVDGHEPAHRWLQNANDVPLKDRKKRSRETDEGGSNNSQDEKGKTANRNAALQRETSVPKETNQVPLVSPQPVRPARQSNDGPTSPRHRHSVPPIQSWKREASVRKAAKASPSSPSRRKPPFVQAEVIGTTVPAQTGEPVFAPPRRSIPLAEAVTTGTGVPKPKQDRSKTLRDLPSHLMESSSHSTDVPSHLLGSSDEYSSSRKVSLSLPVLPLPPVPAATVNRDLRRETRKMNNAVAGFETLMTQAVGAAEDAAKMGRPDEVAQVLEGASSALRKASTMTLHGRGRHGRKSDTLQLSPLESEPDSESDADSSASSGLWDMQHSQEGSAETAPTLVTAQTSKSPLLADPYTKNGRAPRPHHGSLHNGSSEEASIASTPPRLYQPPSADSVVRDFAYARMQRAKDHSLASLAAAQQSYGAAADFYGDQGESVVNQPGMRKSINKPLPDIPVATTKPAKHVFGHGKRGLNEVPQSPPRKNRKFTKSELKELEQVPTNTVPPRPNEDDNANPDTAVRPRKRRQHQPHVSDFFESSYFHHPQHSHTDAARKLSSRTDTRSVSIPKAPEDEAPIPLRERTRRNDAKDVRKHISLREGQGFSLGRYHRRQPIAREWHAARKRIAATVACFNTVFIGLIAGIYAGEVPKMQYQIADINHKVLWGNVLLFCGLGLTTVVFWPLPLLHGRKPYTLLAFALMLPLQFPQAIAVSVQTNPDNVATRCGLLIPRIFTGMALGFANMNQLPTLLDLFGCSLMSEAPHQEIVVNDDIRRQGGGVGIWLGIWAFCFVGSLSIGFCIGACIISGLDPSWGFYIVVILLAFFLLVNVVTPETRRAPYRRSIAHFLDDEDKLRRRVARGEVKLHISNDGPKWWWEEVWAGLILTKRMIMQSGFFVLGSYIGWIYAQVTLVILFLGALLSRDYSWRPQYVGLASLSLAVGALFAMPMAKASVFSRSRFTPQRTDSMTMRAPRLT